MSMSNEILLEAPSASVERRRPTFHWSGDWEWYVGALIVATVLIYLLPEVLLQQAEKQRSDP